MTVPRGQQEWWLAPPEPAYSNPACRRHFCRVSSAHCFLLVALRRLQGSCCSAPNTVSDYDHPTYKPSQWPAGADSRPMPGPYHTAPAMHQASYAVPGYPAQGQNGYGQQQYPGMASAHSYPGNPGAYNQAPGGYPGYPPQVGAMPPQGACDSRARKGGGFDPSKCFVCSLLLLLLLCLHPLFSPPSSFPS